MREDQSVYEMATEVLARQACARAERTGEPLEEALEAVLETEAGRCLGELRDGEHRDKSATQWQLGLQRERAEERSRRDRQLEERRRLREEELGRARRDAWEAFMCREREELELRKDGQLAGLLGEALAGETAEGLRRLAYEDRRQAREGLVALASNGKVRYKPVEELAEGDMAARIAADRLRTAWLKERRDGWLGYGGGPHERGQL